MENEVAQQVMAARAVAPAAADQRVIAKPVQNPVTARALDILLGKRYAQPPTQHAHKQRRVVVELGSLAWGGVQVQASPAGRDKAEVGRAGSASIV